MINIQVVDDIVRETEKLFSNVYRDEETSFIFTADHGMSKIGNHGDGGEVLSRSFMFDVHRSSQTQTTLEHHLLHGGKAFGDLYPTPRHPRMTTSRDLGS